MRVFLSHLFTGGILKNDERPWKDAIKLSAVLLIIMVAFNFNYFVTNSMKLGNDEHCLLSLNRAYNNVFCKQVTSFNSNFTSQIDCSKSINKLFFNNESERQTYCLNSEQLTLNESSLSQVYVILFKIFPTISFNGIHKIFVFFKISSILLFCFLLFRIGLSPFYVFLFSILSCFLIYSASLQNSFFSIYSFFIPFFLLFISLMIVYLYLLKKYIYKLIPFGVLIGAYIAFYMNFRTSYSVVVLYSSLILIIFIYYLMYQILGSKLKSIVSTCLCIFTMYVGFQSYSYVFLKPLQDEVKESIHNYTYHSIMHPLVLSLGLSESSLSTREGITWDDDDGELLAQRIDPSVRYLRKGYEKALLTYYVKLWIYHPQEMFDIYKNKFMNYKTFKIARSIKSKNVTFLNAPFLGMIVLFTYLVNTAWKAWFVLFSSIAMIAVFRGKMSTVGLFISTIVVGVCFLLLLESVIILHVYSATHLSVVNLLFFMIIFYYIQMLVSYLQINRFCRDLKIKNDSYLIRNFLEKQFNKTMKVFRFKP